MFADHTLAVEAVLGDARTTTFSMIDLVSARQHAVHDGTCVSAFYAAALLIRAEQSAIIRTKWPRTWRRAAGYNLNYLLPWSPTTPSQWPAPHYPSIDPGHINLAALMAGSEGTLGIIRKAKIRLVPRQEHTVLAVLFFENAALACDATPGILEHRPSAVELIPRALIDLAGNVPGYANLLNFLPKYDRSDLLVVEYSGDSFNDICQKARNLHPNAVIAESTEEQSQVWSLRKAGLGLLQSQPGDFRSHTFIADLSVPVEHLGFYVREMQNIFSEHNTSGHFYAHASAGCLHMRPILNLKTESGRVDLRSIAEAAVELVISLNGATTGEHGDGLARSEWLERLFGKEIMIAFRTLKQAVDPQGIFNPGKIIDPLPMDENLRYLQDTPSRVWQTTLDFSHQGGFQSAIEICNGAGVCRKTDGTMCPSFQATREELHTTRGRANLLRSMISTRYTKPSEIDDIYAALDLCLACKGCKSECPSGVDMAKIKYEFLHYYFQSHRRKLRDYVFSYVDIFARFGAPFGELINSIFVNKFLRQFFLRVFKLHPKRSLPKFRKVTKARSQHNSPEKNLLKSCLFLSDPYTKYFYPDAQAASFRVLAQAGYRVHLIPAIGAGRTLISKGFLGSAKRQAIKVIKAIESIDPKGTLPIIGIEPSEIYTLRDEYLNLFPHEAQVVKIARRAWMIDEFLIRLGDNGMPRISSLPLVTKNSPGLVLLHGHCYQKSQAPASDGNPIGVDATIAMLQAAGYQVELIDAGCCGMAGAFGYEAEHYALSMQIGELKLFPALRSVGKDVIVAAAGASCQAQINDGIGLEAVHPIMLIGLKH